MSASLVLSIGRNIGSAPMAQEKWEAFTRSAHRAITEHCGALYFAGYGTGFYEGMSEESFTLTAAAPSGSSLRSLVLALRALAREFEQDSVALTVGETELVTAN